MTPRRVHLWIPEWNGPGGIQAYSRNLACACVTLLPESEIHVLARNGPFDWGNDGRGLVTGRTAGEVPKCCRRSAYAALLAATTLRQRPDLIIITHLHFAPIARWLQRWRRIRYWVVAHGIEAWGTLSEAQRQALHHAEKILPVSHHTATRLRATLGAKSPPMERLPNMVDETAFTPGPKPSHLLRRYGLKEDDPILLTVARLDPRQRYKGYDRVLEIFARVRREIPGLRYVIAGRGADSERIRRRVRELNLQEVVILTGFVPERDLCDHYRLCDLFVMPSHAEGFGIVFLEALACGRRVLAGNTDGSAEPLLHGKLGTLVDPHDPDALTAALVAVLRAPHDEAEGEFLRRTTLDHFGAQAFRRRLRELLG
jgi:glycosyltransferase involved in cell wall biosynthesis